MNHSADTIAAPLYRPDEFRELRLPAIPPPYRNYQPPAQPTITMTGQTSLKRTRAVDLSAADLAKGRASATAKRQGKAIDPASATQRILRVLRQADDALTAAEIADALGLDHRAISSRIGAYRKLYPDHIAVLKQPGTNYRRYRWTGPDA